MNILSQREQLKDLIQAVLNCGGTPDLFYPEGYESPDPWDEWMEAARAAVEVPPSDQPHPGQALLDELATLRAEVERLRKFLEYLTMKEQFGDL